MTDLNLLDITGQQAVSIVEGSQRIPVTATEQTELEAMLEQQLPRPGDNDAVMVVMSLRMPVQLRQRANEVAASADLNLSQFIRVAIERAITGADQTQLVNVDDVIQAVARLPRASAA